MCVEVKLPIDKWSLIDLLCSFLNISCFNVIGGAKPESIIDSDKKASLDYYVIAVVIMSWLRFFSYFLVTRQISKFISTLLRMLIDAISFVLIMVSYLLLMSTIFTTLFQSYFNFFNATLGAFAYTDKENFSMSNSIL
jgi:hypothetical protein